MSYQLTYILMKLVLNCHTNWPYTSCGQDFFLFNHFWLCAVVVNHSQSGYSVIFKKAKKDPKIACFWALWNILEGQLFFTTSKIHKFEKVLTTFLFKTLIFHTFLVYLQIMLQNYGNNQCLVMHWLKHKCLASLGQIAHRCHLKHIL